MGKEDVTLSTEHETRSCVQKILKNLQKSYSSSQVGLTVGTRTPNHFPLLTADGNEMKELYCLQSMKSTRHLGARLMAGAQDPGTERSADPLSGDSGTHAQG